MRVIKTARVNKSTLLGIVKDNMPRLTLWLREWINSVIATPVSLLLLLILFIPPNGILKSI